MPVARNVDAIDAVIARLLDRQVRLGRTANRRLVRRAARRNRPGNRGMLRHRLVEGRRQDGGDVSLRAADTVMAYGANDTLTA